MIVTHGRTRGRVSRYGTDDYGRWSWIRLNANTGDIVVISVYQMSDQLEYLQDGNKSTKTFCLQQHSMIQEDNRSGTPRHIFPEDLTNFLDQIKIDGDQILLMGNFNELFQPQSNIMDINDLSGIIDLPQACIGHQNFSTHARNRSNQRIDYALGYPELLNSITKYGYQPIGKNSKGNHRGF